MSSRSGSDSKTPFTAAFVGKAARGKEAYCWPDCLYL